MAKTHERVFALVIAVLFLGTTVAVSVIVVLQAGQQNKADNTAETSQQTKEGTLQGTKLANFSPGQAIDKLSSTDSVVGTGAEVKLDSKITFHYTGALAANGTIFQSSHDGQNQPVTFALADLIPGWQQGLPGMKAGGTRRLLIPWNLGYGEAGSPKGGIPAKADLVFDIEIVSVQ